MVKKFTFLLSQLLLLWRQHWTRSQGRRERQDHWMLRQTPTWALGPGVSCLLYLAERSAALQTSPSQNGTCSPWGPRTFRHVVPVCGIGSGGGCGSPCFGSCHGGSTACSGLPAPALPGSFGCASRTFRAASASGWMTTSCGWHLLNGNPCGNKLAKRGKKVNFLSYVWGESSLGHRRWLLGCFVSGLLGRSMSQFNGCATESHSISKNCE